MIFLVEGEQKFGFLEFSEARVISEGIRLRMRGDRVYQADGTAFSLPPLSFPRVNKSFKCQTKS